MVPRGVAGGFVRERCCCSPLCLSFSSIFFSFFFSLFSFLPKGTAEGDKPKHSGQNALGRRTPCGPFCQKGPRKGTNQNTPAKMPSAGGPPVVPFAKRDRGWNHYRDSISVVPFAKRDRGTLHKCKRDRGWSHYLDSISVVPFAFMSCSVVPFANRDRGNGAMIMVPTVVPFAPLCSIAAKCSKLFERFAAKCSKTFGLCRAALEI